MAVVSVVLVLFVSESEFSAEVIYSVSFVIMQVAFFCVVTYFILRMREWLSCLM
ncbi:hypothetical protein J2128_001791 [Methanomicrobium sp. W14]|uniref:hypothetical protein n=1 Tax=Methanomicrobium sp. W14 TaxID=2817839 RepID=UPI001AE66A41|nr:hypothetical protein [Methanomicrobium sp. W14]MBP2133837.1 hypothetical protein [Methanomicrobium sp. W14]